MDHLYAEVLAGPERRRRFSRDDKQRIVAESLAPGATVCGIARRHGLHPNQLFTWRRLARAGALAGPAGADPAAAGFVPVVIQDAASRPAAREPHRAVPRARMVEIGLVNGRLVRAEETIDPATLARLVAALER